MKTNLEKYGITLSCFPLKVWLFCFLACSNLSCISLLEGTPRAQLANRNYTFKEEKWREVIKENYPGWNQTYPNVQPFYETKQTGKNDSRRLGHPPPEAPEIPAHVLESLKQEEAIPGNLDNTELANELQPKDNPENDLPLAIIDDANTKIPPAANQSFTIIPENKLPKNRPAVNSSLRRYRVLKGETLMQIARKIYGDELAWEKIYNLNRNVLDDPHHLQPGMTLVIP